MRPDTAALPQLDPTGSVRGVIVTLKGDGADSGADPGIDGQHYDFLSRYFAPWVGIHEDPVTGRLLSTRKVYSYALRLSNPSHRG